ncbi:MAG TPA: DLW-39 family protein [Candidatus Limnocylindria bacterium]|nr:DLW-39 family protein [Candidatus Limnocylindria bacterium]
MKKLLVLAVAAAAGAVVWKKMQADQAEQDLWTEATSDSSLDLR